MNIIVVYDISDNKRRERLRKSLMCFGISVQKSVFEFDLTMRQIEKMKRVISGIIQVGKDNVRCYQICKTCKQSVEVFGGDSIIETKNAYVV